MIEVLDLFAGAGGFSLGAHAVTGDVMGLELDDDAVATHTAANMTCYKRDITRLDPNGIGKTNEHAHLHLHASPPCQTFSAAGRGKGRVAIEDLSLAVKEILATGEHTYDLSHVVEGALLVLEPARWIYAMMPDTVSLEQVRSVLPIWEAYAEGMEQLGYFSWTALLNAEQYGVPQTRCRAWLGASLHKVPEPPAPTHSRYHVRSPRKLDPGMPSWVSMAEALGACGAVGFPRRADNDDVVTVDGVDYRARDLREEDQPAFAVTEKARSWSHWRQGKQDRATTRPIDSPAGTIAFGNDMAQMRFTDADDVGFETQSHERLDDIDTPATTIQGAPTVWPRGHKYNQSDIDRLGEDEARRRYNDRAGTGARRVTVDEAGILQGFPSGFPWQGTKTSQFRQVGNAVPPAVAEAVLRSLVC